MSKKTPDSSVKAEDVKTEVPVSQEKTVAAEEKSQLLLLPSLQSLRFRLWNFRMSDRMLKQEI